MGSLAGQEYKWGEPSVAPNENLGRTAVLGKTSGFWNNRVQNMGSSGELRKKYTFREILGQQ